MRLRLLDLLACPACGHPDLELESFEVDREAGPPEVIAGVLSCGPCGRTYPIAGGIPRFLPDRWEEHAEELRPYLDGARGAVSTGAGESVEEIGRFRADHQATRESFGFEWLRYQVTGPAENAAFFHRATGFGAGDLAGRLTLDAGCGMGRFTEVAAGLGAEVVGLDLSRSVERAWRENRSRPPLRRRNVHFVQGDLMRPPFAPGTFERIFSVGVLHHTPDTRRAFHSICPLLAPGGRIAIWVYRTYQPEVPVGLHKRAFEQVAEWINDGVRAVTTRLPHSWLHQLCRAAVPLGWLKRQAGRHRALKVALWPLLLPPVSDHPDPQVRLCDTFDWLSPRFQWKHTTAEVRDWFAEAGLTDVRALEQPVSVAGVRPADSAAARGDRAAGEGSIRGHWTREPRARLAG